MKKTGILFVLMLIFALVLAVSVMAENGLRLIKARGAVNVSDIGGNGLYVYSLWDKSKGSPVGSDGSFVTVISDSRPQKLSVMDDKKMTRALAIVLPEDSERIAFDAKSTAMAILFRDPASFGNSAEAKTLSRAMADNKSFQDLVIFLKKNLPSLALEELTSNTECAALLEKCSDEIFGEDQITIRKSMQGAQNKLQRLLQEK